MIASWMAYVVVISTMLSVAGLLGERVLLRHRLPSRLVWVLAIAGAAGVPAFMLGWGAAGAETGGWIAIGEPTVVEISIEGAGTAAQPLIDPTLLAALDRPLTIGWAALSLSVLFFLVASGVNLRRRRRAWHAADFDGTPVWVSEDIGPAVVGFLRGMIVVPAWIDRLSPDERRLLVTHESEHLRAGDPRLVLFALGMIVAMPWNPGLWWQFGRLRAAIEIDCDRRVLRRSGDIGAYGSLLLHVGRRATRMPLAAAAFSRPATGLERRIRTMLRERPRGGWAATAAMTMVAALVALASCGMDQPDTQPPVTATTMDEPSPRTIEIRRDTEPPTTSTATTVDSPRQAAGDPGTSTQPAGSSPGNPASAPAARAPGAPGSEPRFTPTEVRPTLRNSSEVAAGIERGYPAMLKDAGIGGTTTLWILISEQGEVIETRVYNSSGQEQLDRVAERLIQDVAIFTPAMNGDRSIAVWTQLPITFRVE